MSSSADPASRILTLSDAVAWRNRLSGTVAFTNGVFDLIHPGHVDVLLGARRAGDSLIVALNTDDSVRRLKGPNRPVRSEAERAYVVGSLAMVDAVVLFAEDTPLEVILALRPDVLVKGGDYSADSVVGANEVRSWGGRVAIIPLTPGQSTTAIIHRLRDS